MKCGKKTVLFTLFAMNLVEQPAPEVVIEQGILSGKISADGSFFEYVGIPYATTNSSTRFKVSFVIVLNYGCYLLHSDKIFTFLIIQSLYLRCSSIYFIRLLSTLPTMWSRHIMRLFLIPMLY